MCGGNVMERLINIYLNITPHKVETREGDVQSRIQNLKYARAISIKSYL